MTTYGFTKPQSVNSSPPGQILANNIFKCILANNIFKCIFLNENDRIQIQILLKFVPRSPIDNKPALAWVMAWHWTGDKPLPESKLTQFPDAYMRH